MSHTRCRWLATAVLACAFVFAPSSAAGAADVLYVTNSGSDSLAMLSTAGDTLTPLAGTPITAGDTPWSVVASPDRHRLFVSSLDDERIAAYDIGTDGSLTPVAGSPFAAARPGTLLLSPDGTRLFAGSNDVISAFSVAASGALTPVAGSPFTTGVTGPVNGLSTTPDGRFLYASVFNGTGDLTAFAVAPSGALTPLGGSPYTADPALSGVAVDRAGSHLYLAHGSLGPSDPSDVSVYDIANDGALSLQPGPPVSVGGPAGGPVLSPDGTRLHLAKGGSNNLATFTVAPNGSLSNRVDTPADSGSGRIVISTDGTRLYTANFNLGGVSAFAIGNDGSPVPLAGSPFSTGGTSPAGLALGTPSSPPPDGLAPETTIKGKPRYKQAEDTRFRFGSSISGSTFKCRLDKAPFKDCKSPKNYKRLKPGKHRFEVFAISPDGVADETPERAKFKVKRERKR